MAATPAASLPRPSCSNDVPPPPPLDSSAVRASTATCRSVHSVLDGGDSCRAMVSGLCTSWVVRVGSSFIEHCCRQMASWSYMLSGGVSSLAGPAATMLSAASWSRFCRVPQLVQVQARPSSCREPVGSRQVEHCRAVGANRTILWRERQYWAALYSSMWNCQLLAALPSA